MTSSVNNCIIGKNWISLEGEKISKKEKYHSSSFWKAFQISLFLIACFFHFIGTLNIRNTRRIKSFFPYKDRLARSLWSKVVYKASCWDCNDFYIGKTKRRLHDRKIEHFKALTSNCDFSATADHVTHDTRVCRPLKEHLLSYELKQKRFARRNYKESYESARSRLKAILSLLDYGHICSTIDKSLRIASHLNLKRSFITWNENMECRSCQTWIAMISFLRLNFFKIQ